MAGNAKADFYANDLKNLVRIQFRHSREGGNPFPNEL
jgi:hypothetical protein